MSVPKRVSFVIAFCRNCFCVSNNVAGRSRIVSWIWQPMSGEIAVGMIAF